jgi:hypothetical protein
LTIINIITIVVISFVFTLCYGVFCPWSRVGLYPLGSSHNSIMENTSTFEMKVLRFYSLMMMLLSEWPSSCSPMLECLAWVISKHMSRCTFLDLLLL